jgi:anti-sigma factor RsiW
MFLRGREGKCRRVGALLSEYIDGRLRGGDAEFVDAHLEGCGRCAAELESLRLTVRLLGRVRSVPVPRSFSIREADVASAPARRPWWLLPVPVPGGVREGVGWTSVLAPERMGWLRPATAVVAAALVLVVALDFSQIVPHGANVELIEQLEPSRAVVVTSPGPDQLEDGLKLEVEEPARVPPAPAPLPAETNAAEADGGGAFLQDPAGEREDLGAMPGGEGLQEITETTERGWPMRQIEIAIGSGFVALVAWMLLVRRRRRGFNRV